MKHPLLIIEDEPLLARELERRFLAEGFDVQLADSLEAAERVLAREVDRPLVILSDMSLPDGNALDLLERRRGRNRGQEWIFLTGYGTVSDTVRGLRLGAFDFLEKPVDPDRLAMAVRGAARSSGAQQQVNQMARRQDTRYRVESFLGRSRAADQTRELLARLARVPFSGVLMAGETGTGKGLAARILHHQGPRSAGPLVEVNCAALPRELLESELFGHEPGAFTGARTLRRGLFEQADGGTLFLDEIGEMPLDLQAKVLKVLDDRRLRRLGGSGEIEIELRLVAASNRDLEAMVARGEFRADLYHRLNTFMVRLPPLRERLEDLQDLVPRLVEEFSRVVGRPAPAVDDSLWAVLQAHRWPGNIRELRNVIERGVLLCEQGVLTDLLPGAPRPDRTANGHAMVSFTIDGSLSLEQMEMQLIRAAMRSAEGNLQAAARLLKTTRETLRYRLQKHGLADD